jgi:hypothetical protein
MKKQLKKQLKNEWNKSIKKIMKKQLKIEWNKTMNKAIKNTTQLLPVVLLYI